MQSADPRLTVGWWPDAPCDAVGPALAADLVFPSGRAAIAQCLQAVDLPPNTTIALSALSSACLTRIVRRFGLPTDLRGLTPDVRATVVYEPWGWPLTACASAELNERCAGRLLLLDRVDSADFFMAGRAQDLPAGTAEVASLAKVLGLAGGGLVRSNGRLVAFAPEPDSDVSRRLRSRPAGLMRGRIGYREMFKESRQVVHPEALAWLRLNSVEAAMEHERRARQRHLAILMDSGLSAGWPTWMVDAVAAGAGPVWAPVLRGEGGRRRWSATRVLDERYEVVSAARVFNWSGNPFHPADEVCLALPVHGGVARFAEIVAALD